MAKNVKFESVNENDAIIARIKEFIPNLFGLIFAYFIGKVKVSLLGVVALWGDCTFIPAYWGNFLT